MQLSLSVPAHGFPPGASLLCVALRQKSDGERRREEGKPLEWPQPREELVTQGSLRPVAQRDQRYAAIRETSPGDLIGQQLEKPGISEERATRRRMKPP
jgi:hypothetical protein